MSFNFVPLSLSVLVVKVLPQFRTLDRLFHFNLQSQLKVLARR